MIAYLYQSTVFHRLLNNFTSIIRQVLVMVIMRALDSDVYHSLSPLLLRKVVLKHYLQVQWLDLLSHSLCLLFLLY